MIALSVLEVAMVASTPSIWKYGGVTGITLLHFSRRDPPSKKRRERAILPSRCGEGEVVLAHQLAMATSLPSISGSKVE